MQINQLSSHFKLTIVHHDTVVLSQTKFKRNLYSSETEANVMIILCSSQTEVDVMNILCSSEA